MGLAPTTSTTMMMALGDALAVALMQRRGFSINDYRVLHPGGQLGKSLIRVKDIMHGAKELPLVSPETLMSEVLVTMTAKGFGCAGIIDNKKNLIGIITDGDLRRHMGSDLLSQSAAKVMTRNPKTIRADALAAEAVAFMNNSKPAFLCVFVLDDYAKETNPVGILHMHDCLRAGIV
jgi:arabinose-5-phosphate isomerase